MQRRGSALADLVQEMTPDWHPNLRRLFALTEPDTCFPIAIRTSVPPPPWTPSSVTLLGDAIHTMTPGRGVGANTALRDAVLLCQQLIAVRDGRASVVEAVSAYETKMVDYAFDAVAKSRRQMTSADPSHRPVIGRVVLGLMRTVLRVVNHVSVLKARMAGSMLAYRGAGRDNADYVLPLGSEAPLPVGEPERSG
jgi:2-polyprenyl-6-methoxyphenol hydroxylase-like FAD-dependent oxidoreductase